MIDQYLNRRSFMTGVATLGALTVLEAGTQRSSSAVAAAVDTLQADIKSKQGSWFATLTDDEVPDLQFYGFATFTPDGGLITTGQGDYQAGGVQGTGHGHWVQEGRRIYFKVMKFVFDAEGNLTAIKEEFSTGEMDETSNNFSGTTRTETYDLEGNLIQIQTGRIESVRISLEKQFGKGSLDPATVMDAYTAAINAHDVEMALSYVADDAVYTRPNGQFNGKAEVRQFVESIIARNVHVELLGERTVEGERVNWQSHVMIDDPENPDGPQLEIINNSESIVQDGKIVFHTAERAQ